MKYVIGQSNGRQRAIDAVRGAEMGTVVEVGVEPTRNNEQNARMWAMLTDISAQTDWPVNGKMGKLSKEDWKDIFSAELRKEQRVAQGISGGFVLLGAHTSRMKVRELSDLIELMFMFGAERGIVWTDPTAVPLAAYEETP